MSRGNFNLQTIHNVRGISVVKYWLVCYNEQESRRRGAAERTVNGGSCMDVFVEQIIRRRMNGKDYLIFAGILILGIVLILASMMFIPQFSILILAGVCFGGYFLIGTRNLEFEYSVTNGDLTIDKIINRRSRKRVLSFDVHNVEDMGKYDPQKHVGKTYDKRIVCSATDDGKDSWYMHFRHKDFGNTLLVFSPNEKVLGAIKPFLLRQVSFDAFGRR